MKNNGSWDDYKRLGRYNSKNHHSFIANLYLCYGDLIETIRFDYDWVWISFSSYNRNK